MMTYIPSSIQKFGFAGSKIYRCYFDNDLEARLCKSLQETCSLFRCITDIFKGRLLENWLAEKFPLSVEHNLFFVLFGEYLAYSSTSSQLISILATSCGFDGFQFSKAFTEID